MEYWNPEHPPPTTPIRNPAGTGFCVAIISRTFAIAAGVRVTGVVEAGAPTTTSGVTAAVDIGKSPCPNSDIFKCMRPPTLRQALTRKCSIYRCTPGSIDARPAHPIQPLRKRPALSHFCYYLPLLTSNRYEVHPVHRERLYQHHGDHPAFAPGRQPRRLVHRHHALRRPCHGRHH